MEVRANGHPDFFAVPFDDETVVVAGELDMYAADAVAAALTVPGVRAVDLSGVTFIDVAGLRALATNRNLEMRSASPSVRRLVALCALIGIPLIELV